MIEGTFHGDTAQLLANPPIIGGTIETTVIKAPPKRKRNKSVYIAVEATVLEGEFEAGSLSALKGLLTKDGQSGKEYVLVLVKGRVRAQTQMKLEAVK